MLQNPCKTLGFKKNMVYKYPLGGGKPYPASGLYNNILLRASKVFAEPKSKRDKSLEKNGALLNLG